MKLVSVVTPCYNEEANVEELCARVRRVMEGLPQYRYEHLFIDNASQDATVAKLKQIASQDRNVKIIVNCRNFGHVRSPMHGLYQATGDIIIMLFADLQDPPELLKDLLAEWENGTPVVLAIKRTSEESGLMFAIRTAYYRLVEKLTDFEVYEHFTGFGLYDRQLLDILREKYPDPYPYFRGMIAEVGFPYKSVFYNQKRRLRGITKNNFYTLYDAAMLGITKLSKVPLRLVTFFGFASAMASLLVGLFYLIYKLAFWNSFSVGVAPLVIGIFLFISVQMVSLGIIGEYIGSIHTMVQNRPLVIERERINFDVPAAQGGAGVPAELINLQAAVHPSTPRHEHAR
ncbi:MAG: glycosyltransferase family 2 protein [Bryobacteraceae bacterium]|nr:glycosyltransferase family 2 protein [Bryobacteraceae bacterium]